MRHIRLHAPRLLDQRTSARAQFFGRRCLSPVGRTHHVQRPRRGRRERGGAGIDRCRDRGRQRHKRGPMLDRLLTAHGQTHGAAQGLPADSPARQIVLDSLDLVIAMGAHKDPQLLNGKRKAENGILRDAFDKLGTETQRGYAELETSARGPRAVERARRRINRGAASALIGRRMTRGDRRGADDHR